MLSISTRLSVFVVRKALDTLFRAFKWKSYPNASRQDRNAPGQKTGITKTIVSTYRSQFGLLWRIMLPVVLLAICVDIALFFRDAAFFTTAAESQGFQVEWRVNTLDGIDNTINLDTMDIPHLEWVFERRFGFLPSVTSTRDDGSAWTWSSVLAQSERIGFPCKCAKQRILTLANDKKSEFPQCQWLLL